MNKRKVEVAECLREIECWTIWIQNASACVQPTLAFCVYFLVCNWITVEAMRIIVLMCRRIRAVVFDDWNRIPKSDKRIHRSKAREIISCRQRYGRMTLNSNWRFPKCLGLKRSNWAGAQSKADNIDRQRISDTNFRTKLPSFHSVAMLLYGNYLNCNKNL